MTRDDYRPPPPAPESGDLNEESEPDRRAFLERASKTAMVAGLVGGYGGFALIAGRYLYPASTGEVMWQFVTEADGIEVGESIRYRGPAGETINIAASKSVRFKVSKNLKEQLMAGNIDVVLTRYSDIGLAIMVICIIGIMIVPLPPFLLDLLQDAL